MKQQRTPLRRATAVLLAAVALPLTPALAQDVQPAPAATTPPVYDATPPTPAPAPVPDPIPAPAPVADAPAPVAETPAPAVRTRSPARTATRAATRAAPARTAIRVAPAAPAPAATGAPAPVAEIPAETAAVPELAPLPVAPVEATPPVEESGANTTLWVVAGVLLLGALGALFLMMRRRRRDEVYDDYRTDAYAEEPRTEAAIPVAAAPVVAAAVATETGRPLLDIAIHPRRAGVTGQTAQVEFELEIDNQGNATARDVRISTWMLTGGANSSEMENMLIVRNDSAASAELPAIQAGGEQRISRSVQLSTSEVTTDSVLPVVVAEARYRLPDGSEARTTTSFAVGVLDGAEFAHFAIDNPSGLHDDVEARQLGESEHA